MTRTLFLLSVACLALAAPLRASGASVSVGQQRSDITTLELGKPVERAMQGEATHIYAIRLEAGRFIHVIVDQLAFDVALTLYGPDDKPLGSMDSPNGDRGLEQISAIAEASGTYRLEVASADKSAPAGRYRVTLDSPVRTPSPQDRARISAERTFFEAAELHGRGGPDAFRLAIEKYRASLTLWRAAGDRYEEGVTQNAIGLVCQALGDTAEALDHYNQSAPLLHAAGDLDGEAAALTNIGVVYAYRGEGQKALDLYDRALPLWRAAGDRSGEGRTLISIGFVYSGRGEKQKALDYYFEALPLKRAAGDRREEATTLNNIGAVYDDLGEEQKALDYYNQALLLHRTVQNRAGEANALNNMAGVYDDLGERQKALDYYGQALPIWRAVGSRGGEAATLHNIGRVYDGLGDKPKALDYYNQALPLRRAVGDRYGEAATLHNIGRVHSDLGDSQKALEYYNQALALVRAIGSRAGEARTLASIGKTYDKVGERQKALEYYNQSLPLFRAVRDPLGEAAVLVLLMDYWKGLQNTSLAVLFGKQAIDRFQQVRRNIGGLEKDTRQSFLQSKEDEYRKLAELLVSQGRFPEAQQVLDLLKAEEYSDFTQHRGDTGSATTPVALTSKEQKSVSEYESITGDITAVGQEYTALRSKSSRSADEERRYNELADKLTAANRRLQAFLNSLYENFGKGEQANARVDTINEQTAGLQTLVGELGSGTVAVYTLLLDQKCVMMVITPATRVAREVPIGRIAMRGKVFAFARALAGRDSEGDVQAKARDLYNLLVAPIEKDLQGAHATTLVWSLDDVLRYVPLAALYDGRHYLVERYRNALITTASVGNLKDKPDVHTWRGAAMGVSKDYDGLGELKAVPGELASVVRNDKTPGSHGPIPGTILLDESFTASAMKSVLDEHPPLVHIASHYVFHVGDDTKSYLLLGGKDTGGQGFHLTLADLRDDQRMDFKGTELLTLSACETAVASNDSDGREIDGLGITAQRKGAKAVVATLWQVDDTSVGLLMAMFYTLWVTTPGMTKAEALQQAQLALLHGSADIADTTPNPRGLGIGASKQQAAAKYAHPYYWAPFVLIGNWK